MNGGISVVIPTFNRCEQLSRAIESVRVQTCLPKEIVVVDDGSTDGTREFLHQLSQGIDGIAVQILRQKNRGPAAARNAGVRRSTGEYVAFLDDDDYWLPEKLARQSACLQEDPSLVLLACVSDTLSFPGRGRLVPITDHHLLVRNWFLTPTVIAKRDVLLACGGFPEDMRYCEDYACWLRIAHAHPCALLNECLVQCGSGKPSFGASGLSADLAALHEGEVEALRRWRKETNVSWWVGHWAQGLAWARHWRRKVIVAMR